MKTLVVLVCAALAAAAPSEKNAVSKTQDSHSDGLGNQFFEQSDGTTTEAKEDLKNAGANDETIAVIGASTSYWWNVPESDSKTDIHADNEGSQPVIEQEPSSTLPVGVLQSLIKQ